jgi:hypothetical protein
VRRDARLPGAERGGKIDAKHVQSNPAEQELVDDYGVMTRSDKHLATSFSRGWPGAADAEGTERRYDSGW